MQKGLISGRNCAVGHAQGQLQTPKPVLCLLVLSAFLFGKWDKAHPATSMKFS